MSAGEDVGPWLDIVELEGGECISAHTRENCRVDGTKYDMEHYPIYSLSTHHLRGWPQHWSGVAGIMERRCIHGFNHPDPDEPKLKQNPTLMAHGCDGCCKRPA